MERFEPVADRIVKDDEFLDPALIGQRPRTARRRDMVLFQMGCQRIERRQRKGRGPGECDPQHREASLSYSARAGRAPWARSRWPFSSLRRIRPRLRLER